MNEKDAMVAECVLEQIIGLGFTKFGFTNFSCVYRMFRYNVGFGLGLGFRLAQPATDPDFCLACDNRQLASSDLLTSESPADEIPGNIRESHKILKLLRQNSD